MMAGLAAAAGALIFGLLAWLLYKFGVFVMCTALVYSIAVSFFQDAGLTQHFIALVIGLFAGTFALGYIRWESALLPFAEVWEVFI